MGRDLTDWRIESGEAVGRWTAERLRMGYFAERSQALGLVRDGQLIAGAIYENWNGRSIMAHFVVEGRLTRAYLGALFDYAYVVCDVCKVICPVSEGNTKSRKLLCNMGFELEAELSDCDPQGSILLYTLRKDACRFLGEKYGKIRAKSAAAA